GDDDPPQDGIGVGGAGERAADAGEEAALGRTDQPVAPGERGQRGRLGRSRAAGAARTTRSARAGRRGQRRRRRRSSGWTGRGARRLGRTNFGHAVDGGPAGTPETSGGHPEATLGLLSAQDPGTSPGRSGGRRVTIGRPRKPGKEAADHRMSKRRPDPTGPATLPGPVLTAAPPGAPPSPVGPTPPPNPYPYRKLYRNKDERFLAGVAAGLAEHLRLPTVVVRLVFIGLMLANGLGVLLYIAFWAVLPVKPRTEEDKPRRRRGNRLQRLGLGALVAGVIVL